MEQDQMPFSGLEQKAKHQVRTESFYLILFKVCRPIGAGGAGGARGARGAMIHPDFGRSVNPI